MANLEIEVKFRVEALPVVRQKLLACGGILAKPRVHEKNTVYDDAQQSIKNRASLIRLRQDERVKLTYKGIPAVQVASDVKVREEIEVEVADFDKMEQIIGRLGYQPALIYEKYRETFEINHVEVVLDELPYGDFVELEGEEEAIKATADLIGLDWSQRLNTNYLRLFETIKTVYHLTMTDLTFENFVGLEIDWARVKVLLDNETAGEI